MAKNALIAHKFGVFFIHFLISLFIHNSLLCQIFRYAVSSSIKNWQIHIIPIDFYKSQQQKKIMNNKMETLRNLIKLREKLDIIRIFGI